MNASLKKILKRCLPISRSREYMGKFLARYYNSKFQKFCIIAEGVRLRPGCRIYNDTRSRDAITIGAGSIIDGELMVFGGFGKIEIGESCFVGPNTRVWSNQSIRIGNRVLISHNVNIFDSMTHQMDSRSRAWQFGEIVQRGHPKGLDLGARPICIGDDCWVACNAILLRGVTLGRGCVVGAGSVVTKDVEEYTIVAGNPAKYIGRSN